jgi:hypothetical protein
VTINLIKRTSSVKCSFDFGCSDFSLKKFLDCRTNFNNAKFSLLDHQQKYNIHLKNIPEGSKPLKGTLSEISGK